MEQIECGRPLINGPFGVIRCHATSGLCPRCGHCFDWGAEDTDVEPHCTCGDDRALIMWDMEDF